MNEVISINGMNIQIKEYQGQRVVTFRDIDEIHGRADGTARRNYYKNQDRFIDGKDFFVRNSYEAKSEYGIVSPNGLTLITESGYLMLVKSLTDDLSWTVQRQLVDTYFRVKTDPMLDLIKNDPIMQLRYSQLQMEERIKANESKTQLIESRLNSIDGIDIQGDDQQKLNQMIRKYAFQQGLFYNKAWSEFKKAFNLAYRTNIELLIENYKKKHHIKSLTVPAYLKYADKLQDAVRVADKMLNQ